ncbi:putative ribonuclease H-like domain-containing protein [Tanacetum coccineum]
MKATMAWSCRACDRYMERLLDIIVDGDLQEKAVPAGEQSSVPAPKIAKQLTAKRNQERVKSILLLAIPDEYLLKFHNVPDAKSLWVAIKSRFGGNYESKKMQRNVLKHQFENFTTAPNEISKEDINQKFMRSLPPSWSQIALIMRNKPDIDQTDIDDLYNNLRVYEDEIKRSSSSTSNSQNLAFLSSENTSSTNEVSTASGNFGVNTAGGTSLTSQVSSTPGADEVVCSFFSQQTTSPPLDNEDLQQIDQDDLEELDIRWQVAMLTVRVQRFIQKTGRNLDFKGKQPVTFDKSKVECYNCHRKGHFAKECKSGRNQGKSFIGGYDWSNDFDEPVNFALMAISSSSSSSSFDNELKCREVKNRTTYNEPEKVVKERDELKVKIEKWEESSKGLNKILNSQMSAKDKNGLRYGIQLDEISNKSETDSEISKTNEVNIEKPKSVHESVVSKPNINRDKVIIEDIGTQMMRMKSTNHLIKDCDFYAKKSPEPKVKTVVNTGQRVVKPVWDNAKRVNQQKISNNLKYPQARRTVRLNGKRAVHTVSTTRPISTARPVSTARQFVPKIAQTGSAIRPIYPRMDNVRPRASYSPIKRSYYTKPAFRPKDLKQDVKISRVKNMTTAGTRAVVNTGQSRKHSTIFWIVVSSHMDWQQTLIYSDYKVSMGGFVAYGSDPKGDELKFNLFSVSQMCDKKNSVLFTDTECLILSPSFKLLDESQVILRAPRQNGSVQYGLKATLFLSELMYRIQKVAERTTTYLAEAEQVSKDDLERMIAQEIAAKSIDDATIQAFEEELFCSPPIPTLRVHKDHPKGQILGDPKLEVQTRGKIQKASSVQQALEEGIDYNEVFAPVARIEAIRLFLAFASFMGFPVYQMDVKSSFLYGTIEEEVYVHQPLGFFDPTHPNKVYKVIKALYGLHQALRAWYETLSSFLLENGFRRVYGTEFEDCMHKRFQISSMGELTFFLGLQVKQQPDGIFISQDKYVANIPKKFDFCSIKIATTPIMSNKPLVKDEDGVDVDVHIYRSMISSLIYLTASRLDIMFAVCACARFQVTPKPSHLNAVKRIFRYLKHQPKLRLWYPRDSPFELESFSDSDYGGASLDRKSTTCGCQFLGRRLISWQCKKQTIMANSTTKAEYVAAANCCRQVLWIQMQMMDYGFNFMNTKIHIDNDSTICIVNNPIYHSRTKHIEIRHHFIRDCYEKRLIDVIKIHTNANVADLLTKGFDVTRFNFLVFVSATSLVNTARPTLSTARWSAGTDNRIVGANVVVGSEVVKFVKYQMIMIHGRTSCAECGTDDAVDEDPDSDAEYSEECDVYGVDSGAALHRAMDAL